ncbi:hypothetical protein N0V88_002605 [Collariella sp. IMI 366227]|nr:hypothetical protein N0V88_002605 [Collariella sp. IMI 366227]
MATEAAETPRRTSNTYRSPSWDTTDPDERHTYEKCQYVEFKKRVAKMNELREAKGGARSN